MGLWDTFEISGMGDLADYIAGGQGIVLPQPLPGPQPDPGASTNELGGKMMPAYNRDQVWQDFLQYPAFDRARAANPSLGDPLGPERDYGDIRVRFYAGGIIWARIGDWDNTKVARRLDQLPLVA